MSKKTTFMYQRKSYLPDLDSSPPKGQRQPEAKNVIPEVDTMKERKLQIKQILEIDPNISLPNAKKHDKMILTLIPLNRASEPESDRGLTANYFINIDICEHSGNHNYENFDKDELVNRGIHSISEETYGIDYPIVSKHNLIYCQLCLRYDSPILVKSTQRGSLNFVCSMATLTNVSHVTIPDYVNMNEAITINGDDVWVNLNHELIDRQTTEDIRDRIIATTGRKNFRIVYIPPPPYDKKCEPFSDFGILQSIETNEHGYGGEKVIVQADLDKHVAEVESDNETDNDDADFDTNETNLAIQATIHKPPTELAIEPKSESSDEIIPQELNSANKSEIIPTIINQTKNIIDNDDEQCQEMLNQLRPMNFTIPNDNNQQNVTPLTVSKDMDNINDQTDEIPLLDNDVQETKQRKASSILSLLSSLTSESNQTKTSDGDGETVDHMIKRLLDTHPPHSSFSTLLMLEKTYLSAKINNLTDEIVLDFKHFDCCKNILLRDWRHYIDSPMGTSMIHDINTEKSLLELLLQIKYHSVIPEHKVRVTSFYVSIDLN